MVVKSSSIVQASVISALLLVSVLSIIQLGTAQLSGKFTADLQPRAGSNATGKATLETGDGKTITYTITATGINSNITNVAISQDTGSGRAPDVVTLKASPQSGLAQGSGNNELSGNFTATDLMGPLEGKSIADFVKAINDGKIIIRVSTMPFPLGEIYGTVNVGGNETMMTGNMTGNMTAN